MYIYNVQTTCYSYGCHSVPSFPPGSLDFLEKPTVAFVRLKAATVLDSALEAAVPVRFVFVLIGPGKNNFDYHETGRAMAALMADKVRGFYNSILLILVVVVVVVLLLLLFFFSFSFYSSSHSPSPSCCGDCSLTLCC